MWAASLAFWRASVMVEAGKQFRPVNGHLDLPALRPRSASTSTRVRARRGWSVVETFEASACLFIYAYAVQAITLGEHPKNRRGPWCVNGELVGPAGVPTSEAVFLSSALVERSGDHAALVEALDPKADLDVLTPSSLNK